MFASRETIYKESGSPALCFSSPTSFAEAVHHAEGILGLSISGQSEAKTRPLGVSELGELQAYVTV